MGTHSSISPGLDGHETQSSVADAGDSLRLGQVDPGKSPMAPRQMMRLATPATATTESVLVSQNAGSDKADDSVHKTVKSEDTGPVASLRRENIDMRWVPCERPIVMAGGKKIPVLEALTMAYNAVQEGASGVDMGRNIFQADAPKAMMKTVHKVVHENLKPADALEMYETLKNQDK